MNKIEIEGIEAIKAIAKKYGIDEIQYRISEAEEIVPCCMEELWHPWYGFDEMRKEIETHHRVEAEIWECGCNDESHLVVTLLPENEACEN